jgi:small subunit ribosomal protein S17
MGSTDTPQTSPRASRKVRQGVVVSDKMDKTVVVRVERRTTHPLYGKTVTRSEKYHVHDETNDVSVGDRVRITETRPLSKTKRWRVLDVIERAK